MVDGVSLCMFSPLVLGWTLMTSLILVVEAAHKPVVSDRSHFVRGADDDAPDLGAAVLAPRAYVSGQSHESSVPISHVPSLCIDEQT
jgi:TfoX/Sxy family transcriptional regulator of competence genes